MNSLPLQYTMKTTQNAVLSVVTLTLKYIATTGREKSKRRFNAQHFDHSEPVLKWSLWESHNKSGGFKIMIAWRLKVSAQEKSFGKNNRTRWNKNRTESIISIWLQVVFLVGINEPRYLHYLAAFMFWYIVCLFLFFGSLLKLDLLTPTNTVGLS